MYKVTNCIIMFSYFNIIYFDNSTLSSISTDHVKMGEGSCAHSGTWATFQMSCLQNNNNNSNNSPFLSRHYLPLFSHLDVGASPSTPMTVTGF